MNTHPRSVVQFALCLTILLVSAFPLHAQSAGPVQLAPAQKGNTATVVGDAPIYLLPDSTRQPLRLAKQGSVLRVIARTAAWVNVEFLDPQFGRRVGYIAAASLRDNDPDETAPAVSPGRDAQSQPPAVPAQPRRQQTARRPPPANRPGAAASAGPRGFIILGGAYQFTRRVVTESRTLSVYGEDEPVAIEYQSPRGPAVDVTGGVRVAPRFYIGAGVSRFSVSTPTTVTATIPHPSFFNQGRDLTFAPDGIARTELTVHVQARMMVPLARRVDLSVYGGPSIVALSQDTVTSFTYTDTYPNDTVSLAGLQVTRAQQTKVGAHVGGEVSFRVAGTVSVGAGVRWTGAKADVAGFDGLPLPVKTGGVLATAGLRVAF